MEVREKASEVVVEGVRVWFPVWRLLFCGFLVVTATKAQVSARLGEARARWTGAMKAVIALGHSQPNKGTLWIPVRWSGQKPAAASSDHYQKVGQGFKERIKVTETKASKESQTGAQNTYSIAGSCLSEPVLGGKVCWLRFHSKVDSWQGTGQGHCRRSAASGREQRELWL